MERIDSGDAGTRQGSMPSMLVIGRSTLYALVALADAGRSSMSCRHHPGEKGIPPNLNGLSQISPTDDSRPHAQRKLVELINVEKRYGRTPAVKPANLSIEKGEFLAILGPSGCGKTTLLRMIGGFVEPSGGAIRIDGADITRLLPEKRPTNMVFQGYGLFPHMTVAQNIAYGLRIRQTPAAELKRRVGEALELVHLTPFAGRMATELSGGQAQRVALARALVLRPQVLLLDEPFAALDLKLRKAMQEEMRRIHAAAQGTFVFVTHDQDEAMGLASRICVMQDGEIVQDGRPEEIYRAPKTLFVATFIGEANLIRGRRTGGIVELPGGLRLASAGADGDVTCLIRPERMAILPGRASLANGRCIHGTLKHVVYFGTHVRATVRTVWGQELAVETRGDGQLAMRADDAVTLSWQPGEEQILAGHA
jgi:spermidine/putrescine transport system ATP-binding protein